MERREALRSIGMIGGGSLFPAVLAQFLASCKGRDMSRYSPVFFSKEEYQLAAELADIIIPATRTLSATQVNVPVFLDQVFSQCLPPDDQEAVHKGLKELTGPFESATDKTALIRELDEKAFKKKEANGWFRLFKRYTLIGYFTSEEGVTKASNYVKVPEAYKGDIPATAETLNYGKTTLHY